MVATAVFPDSPEDLTAVQVALGAADPPGWRMPADPVVAGCFACTPRGRPGRGEAGEPVWAAAAAYRGRRCVGRATVTGTTAGPYTAGLLALRVGGGLAAAVMALSLRPDVVLVDATGRDHPRRAGLALHLGAVLDLPTVGVTHRPLLATGDWPRPGPGDASPLLLDGRLVGYWLRTRSQRRPVAVHAGWRTDPDTAVEVVQLGSGHRTPVPLREARRLARLARASAQARSSPS